MNNNLLQIMKRQWKLVLAVVILGAVASLIISLVQKPLYRTSAEVLVIPNNAATVDAYTAAKSAEQLALTFSEISYTNSFMDSVLAESSVELDSLQATAWQRKKNWEKVIDTKVVDDTGFLRINVYAPDKRQSALLARSVTSILTETGTDYLGSDTAASIKLIDGPITYDRVAKPNLWQNMLLGTVLGLLAGIGIAYLFPRETNLDLLSAFNKTDSKGKEEDIFAQVREHAAADVQEKMVKAEPASSRPSEAPSGIGAPPAGLPVMESSENKSVLEDNEGNEPVAEKLAEGEKVEIAPEDHARHWLETGQLKK